MTLTIQHVHARQPGGSYRQKKKHASGLYSLAEHRMEVAEESRSQKAFERGETHQ